MNKLSAPFPWFGGKSRVTDVVLGALGDVPNYVEPFFGSGAVLLSRPHSPRIETINDFDGMVSNFWRAIKYDPEQVAHHADWPVNENDLHARHIWLVNKRGELTPRLDGNPDYYDAKIAGWWVWGICSWIGNGWCSGKGPWVSIDGKLEKVGNGQGINRKLVHLGDAGRGINRKSTSLIEWFSELSERLRNVRVCSGDWSRVCGPSVTIKNGLTGVFLDPPYGGASDRCADLYSCDDLGVASTVRKWCAENGDNKMMRIVLCGYAGEGHEELEQVGWRVHEWKSKGGYGSQGEGPGRENSNRERIWFSPHCLIPTKGQMALFS